VSPELWSKVESVTELVLAEPEASRETALLRACGDDGELLSEVRQFLAQMEAAPPDFLPIDPLEEALPELMPGVEVGRFELVRELGAGGSGAVWEARQRDIQRTVALKVSLTIGCSQREIDRLRREADLAGRLRHEHIVTVFEQGELPGCLWIAMELVEGHDLRDEIDLQWRRPSSEARAILPAGGSSPFVAAVAAVGRDIAEALQVAHHNGVLHRDIKPANVLLQPNGRPKVVDFGLAKVDADAGVSSIGEVIGTPYYMSPEQARGERVDARTDVYSVGAVLFHLLTGGVPFVGRNSGEVLHAVRESETPTLRQRRSELPVDLEAIVAKAMQKRPEDRYYDAAALAEDLERFLARRPVLATRYTVARRAWRWAQRNVQLLAVVAAMVVVAVGVAWLQGRREHWRVAEELEGRVGALEREVDAEMAASADPRALVSMAGQLDAVRRDHAVQHPDVVRRAVAAREQIDAHGRLQLQVAEERERKLLAAGGSITPIEQVDLFKVIEGYDVASQLMVDAGVVEDRASLAGWLPTLTVDSQPTGATVSLHRIVLPSCEYEADGIELGQTPLRAVPFFPGYYRVVLKVPGHGHAEVPRWLGNWNEGYDLGAIPIKRFDDVRRDMVPFEAGEAPVTVPVYSPTAQGGGVELTSHRAFLIDRTEVSNAQYLEFFEAMGQPRWLVPGSMWKESAALRESRSTAWLSRPAAVSWRQAARFCEWAGKRLPSDAEWTAAAGVGLRGRGPKYPWGDDPPVSVVVARYVPPVGGDADAAELFKQFMRFCEPVGSVGQDVTARGLLHMGGNVSEWTDTVALGNLMGHAYPLFTHRKRKGWNWMRRFPPYFFTYSEEQSSEPFREPMVGFRCAVSMNP